jgi:hypothetical protein
LLNIGASKSDFEANLIDKMSDSRFLEDILPLLPNDVHYDPNVAYAWFVKVIIPKL